jgi:uncharacterized RDD family membrane protein YckC
MAMNFITDQEIDSILGKIKEYKEDKNEDTFDKSPLDSYDKEKLRKDYSVKASQKYLVNKSWREDLKQNKEFYLNLKPSGVVSKSISFLVDLSITSTVTFAFIYSFMVFGLNSLDYTSFGFTGLNGFSNFIWGFTAVFFLINFSYFLYFETMLGKTIGKMLLNIKVVDKNNKKIKLSKAFIRTSLFFIPFLGLFNIHDKITDSKVVYKG